MVCPICQSELILVQDGCSTDRGWKDESYFACPLHGESFDCEEVETSRRLDLAVEATVERIVEGLGLGAFQLAAFQEKVGRQGRNWLLVLICGFDAGCRSFESLMRFVRVTGAGRVRRAA
jgi:hypothetical protein